MAQKGGEMDLIQINTLERKVTHADECRATGYALFSLHAGRPIAPV
jgi:hypothetical protein